MGKNNKKGLEMKLAYKKEMKEKRKNMKEILTGRRAKLIVKNLPFKANAQNLKLHFEQFGEVEEVNILKQPDGKLVGCAFVQFKVVQKAAKARHHLNGKAFLDRVIEVDFAKAKNKYKKEKEKKEKERKEEKPEDDVDLSIVKIEDDETIKDELKEEETKSVDDVKLGDDSESDDSSEEENETCENASEIDIKTDDVQKKPHVISNDVSEGKTVFIKNVAFSTTNEDLRQCMFQFGPTYYALICVDRLTEHSKGTAFVKFRNKEDAEKCLKAGTELTLQGNILDCHPAINRNDLMQKEKDKKVKQKDSRNLYLVKEGVILAGTKASEGVSSSDMAKRLQLEQYKTQMLRNLNMYISRMRLIIHNLPATWNDSKLRALFKKHSNSDAVIREAKVMRDMRNLDSHGIGTSKEYGFVSFTNHEDALKVIRTLNNNPAIFTANKRPIVAFSIENRAVLKGKEKRLQRSKMRNPNSKDYNPNTEKKEESVSYQNKRNLEEDTSTNRFTGVTARPGVNKMRNRFNLRTQAKLHFENLKKEKKKQKDRKSLKERKQNFRKQPRQKINKKEEIDSFSVLVNKYKESLRSSI